MECMDLQLLLTLSARVPEGYSSCPVCLCVVFFCHAPANPRTGASRCLTEGISGLSGTFGTELESRFLFR